MRLSKFLLCTAYIAAISSFAEAGNYYFGVQLGTASTGKISEDKGSLLSDISPPNNVIKQQDVFAKLSPILGKTEAEKQFTIVTPNDLSFMYADTTTTTTQGDKSSYLVYGKSEYTKKNKNFIFGGVIGYKFDNCFRADIQFLSLSAKHSSLKRAYQPIHMAGYQITLSADDLAQIKAISNTGDELVLFKNTTQFFMDGLVYAGADFSINNATKTATLLKGPRVVSLAIDNNTTPLSYTILNNAFTLKDGIGITGGYVNIQKNGKDFLITETRAVKYRPNVVLLSMYYDFENSSNLTPFVTVGTGYASVSREILNEDTNTKGTSLDKVSKSKMPFVFGAGLTYKYNNYAVDFAVRQFMLGKFGKASKSSSKSSATLVSPNYDDKTKLNYTALTLTLRYSL